MKKELSLLLLLFFNIPLFSQVNFESLSLNEALQKSKETGKLVFLQLESSSCLQCNEVADKAFSNKSLGEKLNQSFICIKISANHADRETANKLFNKKANSFGSFFITPDNSLIHVYNKTTTKSEVYEKEADIALTKAGEGSRLIALQNQYKEGNRSIGLLELYLNTLKALKLNTDDLLEEYNILLPSDSLSSPKIFIFVINMTQLLESKAYEKIGKFYETINKKNYNGNYPFHSTFKTAIAYKSLKKAINEKDEVYAIKVADYSRNIYPKEPEKASKAYYSNLLEYYISVIDTVKYFKIAAFYFDRFYMDISIDSIRKNDTIKMNELAKKTTAKIEKKGDSVIMRKEISYKSETQSLSNQLSEAARYFWKFTSNQEYLLKAKNWAKKALEFHESFTTQNTYALLLNKIGQKQEAISWQEKAILLKKKYGLDTKSLEKELKEMK